jgi:hypothetical protein
MAMYRRLVITAAATSTAFCLAHAADWVDIKDPAELRALYSNKTFRGNGWVGHYRTDGTGILIVQGSAPVRRKWAVKAPDQVCVTPETGSPQCFTFKYVSADHKRILITNASSGGSTFCTLEDGVPKF